MPARKRDFIVALVSGTTSSLIASCRPLLISSLTTDVHWTKLFSIPDSFTTLVYIPSIYLLMALEVIDLFFLISTGFLLARFSSSYAVDLRTKLTSDMLTAMAHGDSESLSKFASYLKTYIETVEEYLRGSLVPSIVAIFTIIGSLFLASKIDASLTFLLGLEVLSIFIFTFLYSGVYTQYAKRRFAADGMMLDNASIDVKKGISIWFSGIGGFWSQNRIIDIKNLAQARYQLGKLDAIYFNSMTFLIGAFMCLGYVVILQTQKMEMQTFLAYVLYAGMIIGPVARFCAFVPETRQFLIAFTELRGPCHEAIGITLGSKITIVAEDYLWLPNIVTSLRIESGERLVIIGPSGAGKTAILQSIIGLRADVFGTMTINGVSSQQLGMHLPETGIFYLSESPAFEKGTLRENLFSEREKLQHFSKNFDIFPETTVSYMDTFFDRKIDASGLPLSLGERQRVQLLRTLLKGPRVLIMDEALSGISEDAEAAIVERLLSVSSIDILIYVSHRSRIQKMFSKAFTLGEI